MWKIIPGTVLGAGLLCLASVFAPVNAALVLTAPTCTAGGAVTTINPNPVFCAGSFAGPALTQQIDVLATMQASFVGLTGLGSWSLADSAAAGSAGTQITTINMAPGRVDGAPSTGTIGFVSPLNDLFGLVLGSTTNFSMYLFDGTTTAIPSVQYTTAGTEIGPNGNPNDLLSVSLYTFEADGPDPNAIPLPASGLLFGFGLAGFGLLRVIRGKSANAG